MDKEHRLQLLKDEYVMLQGFYEDIDRRCLMIKNWDVTVGLAALGAGALYSGLFFLGAFLAAIMFWYLETYWRGLGYFFARRIKQIEAGLSDKGWEKMAPLQTYHTWEQEYDKVGSQKFRYLFREITLLPHVAIAITGLVMFLLWLYGITIPL